MEDLRIQEGVTIPAHELEISTSRSGGPGGQHVNKTDTRITIRWNIAQTLALSPEQKERVMAKLSSQLTQDGCLVVHSSATRSQLQNKELALDHLTSKIRAALYVPKKRIKRSIPKATKEKILQHKRQRGEIKRLRKPTSYGD